MKRIFTLLFSLSLSYITFGQVDEGFYRVKNAETGRYLYVHDNTGKAEVKGAQLIVDLNAVYLRADLENAISDPGSIIYVEKHGSQYDFAAQGTSVYSILSNYVSITQRNGHYSVGTTKSGVSAYLCDSYTRETTGYGVISTDSKGARLWDPILLDSQTDNYFGIKPSVKSGSKYYSSFYASFGYRPVSSDTKVYSVSKVSDYAVLLSEITNDVPNATPVIIECTSDSPSNNKLDIKLVDSSLSDNLLKGVYFNTDNSNDEFAAKVHINQTKVTDTHRVLSVNNEGKLVFKKSNLQTLEANSSYLEVSSAASDVLPVCFSLEEFESYNSSSILTISASSSSKEVYDLLGKKVDFSDNLPSGIYIIDGKKTVIR